MGAVSTLEVDILHAIVSTVELSTPPLLIKSSFLRLLSPVEAANEVDKMFQDILGMCVIAPEERK